MFASVVWIAYSPTAFALLVGLSSSTDSYYEIDPATGVATYLSSSSADASYAGLTFLNGTFYASDLITTRFPQISSNLYSVDPQTGTETLVNNQGGQLDWHGLAANQANNLLYAVAFDDDTLKTITPSGTITNIAPVNINVRGLAYDDSNGILYAINGGNVGGYPTQGLYTIDTTTGTSNFIGTPNTSFDSSGLAFDENTGTLYMNNGVGLYNLDTSNGQATLIGLNGVAGIDGLAWASSFAVPLPSALWLFGSGLLGLIGMSRRKKAT